jgi:poly-gamma-glutamate synthesis protein (capsule biosynthesis protein)
MSPENLPCLSVARPCVYTVANNHVMDFGPRGLEETLSALASAGIATAGAGRDMSEARRPAVVTVRDSRVVVLALGARSSGIPDTWGATRHRAGVDLLPDLSAATAGEIATRVLQVKRPGDVVVTSVHWGSNWGHGVPAEHVGFAHRLIDGGVDVVHGHSSHHPRPIEVYAGKLILYGCGDLIDDYEGIGGYESYRDDLRLQYLASVEADTGRLAQLQMAPLQARQMRLHHASSEDAEHLRSVLDRISRDFGSRIARNPDGMLQLRSEEI